MSCASVADEELDDDDELVLLLSLSNSFSARKACSLRFFLAAGRHAMVLQRFRVTWKGKCWTAGTLADAPLTRIYRETVADFGIIPGIFSSLSYVQTCSYSRHVALKELRGDALNRKHNVLLTRTCERVPHKSNHDLRKGSVDKSRGSHANNLDC